MPRPTRRRLAAGQVVRARRDEWYAGNGSMGLWMLRAGSVAAGHRVEAVRGLALAGQQVERGLAVDPLVRPAAVDLGTPGPVLGLVFGRRGERLRCRVPLERRADLVGLGGRLRAVDQIRGQAGAAGVEAGVD